jgi:hypothetical protein
MQPDQQLGREAIDRFRAIYQEEFSEDLSDDCAQEMALRVLRLFDMLSQECDDACGKSAPHRPRPAR